MSTTDKYILKL